jgi:hypothetical protein
MKVVFLPSENWVTRVFNVLLMLSAYFQSLSFEFFTDVTIVIVIYFLKGTQAWEFLDSDFEFSTFYSKLCY